MAKKKKILLLSDDLRMHSGIATMSRELVLGTVHHYDWVQIAGAIKHPEANKVVDLSQATRDMVKIPDAYVKLYPTDGYGNDQMLFAVMQAEKPDAISHRDWRRGAGGQQHCVAIRWRFGYCFGSDEAVGAATIVDHDDLTGSLGHLVRDQACSLIRGAASRKSHNEADRFVRIVGGLRHRSTG